MSNLPIQGIDFGHRHDWLYEWEFVPPGSGEVLAISARCVDCGYDDHLFWAVRKEHGVTPSSSYARLLRERPRKPIPCTEARKCG